MVATQRISYSTLEGLRPMAQELMQRYQQAVVEPPSVLYTDRECCARSGQSKYQVNFAGVIHCQCTPTLPLQVLFVDWKGLLVCLDINCDRLWQKGTLRALRY